MILSVSVLPKLRKALTALLLLSAGLCVTASYKRAVLPEQGTLRSELELEPEQTEISERAFVHEWRGERYVVHPVAEYTITGLLVSRNDIGGFSDIYHTSSSVDVVDVCLVWGDNARERAYKAVEFWSEPFSCWFRADSFDALQEFRADQMSNTHVLAKDEFIAKRLNRLRLGDQIRMRGRLVNYNPAGASEALRKTSLVRDDTGNGACEVMFVEELEVLKRGNPGWNSLFDYSRVALIILAIAKLLSMLTFPYLEYRYS